MLKKITAVFVIFLIIIGVYWGFKQLKQEHLPPVETIDAVPTNASALFIIKNFETFNHKTLTSNLFWEELSAVKQIKELNENFAKIDSALKANEEIVSELEPEVVISLHTSGANKFDFIFTLQSTYLLDEKPVKTKLEKVFGSTVTSRVYDNLPIYTINLPTKLYCVASKRFVAFSYSSILIEDVVRHLNSQQSLFDNKQFAAIYKTLGTNADFYLMLKPDRTLQNFKKYFKHYFTRNTYYSDWMVFDGDLKTNALELTGFSLAVDSANHFLSVFTEQSKQKVNIPSVLPKSTAFYYHIGFSDSKTYQKKYIQYLKGAKLGFKRDKHIEELNKQFQSSFEKEFLFRLVDEAAFAIAQPPVDDVLKLNYVVLKCTDADKIMLLITQNSEQPQSVLGVDVYAINTEFDFEILLNPMFPKYKNPVVFIWGDYLVFASNSRAAEEFIRQNNFNNTLTKDEAYASLSDNIASESNATVYLNIPKSENLIYWALSDKARTFVKENKETINKYQAIVWQTSYHKNNLFYQYVYAKYNPSFKLSTSSLWELALDTIYHFVPQPVINHKTGLKEIVVQDVNNTLYLISSTGKILWKKQLPLPVKGKIFQIDRYKNNKLQLLFNTAEKLYLLDRNGNHVESFPVKLPEKASAGLQVVDYDNNRQYRILVPCLDNKVYNYNAEGKLVKGWEFETQASPIIKIYPHFAINGKDYLTFVMQNGSVLVTGRNGKQRLNITEKIPFTSFTANYLDINKTLSNTAIIGIDTAGTLIHLYYNNKISTTKINGPVVYADFGLIDNNTNIDVVYSFKNQLKAYTFDNANLFKTELPDEVKFVKYYRFGQQKLIGAITSNEVYLYNNEGELLPDFPVKGNAPFTIDDLEKDGKPNLIVGDGKILMNYQIQK
jgi:hypothetical protein